MGFETRVGPLAMQRLDTKGRKLSPAVEDSYGHFSPMERLRQAAILRAIAAELERSVNLPVSASN